MSECLGWLHLTVAVRRLAGLEVAEDPGDVGQAVWLREFAGGDHRPEEVHHTVQVPGVLDVLGQHQGNTGDVVFFSSSFGFLHILASDSDNKLKLVKLEDGVYGWHDDEKNITIIGWGHLASTEFLHR